MALRRCGVQIGSWVFLLVSVPEDQLDAHTEMLQTNMVPNGKWYAHYFTGEELLVVYWDAVFRATTNPKTWGPVIEHGLKSGIPLEQLDFNPRTMVDAGTFFSVKMALEP